MKKIYGIIGNPLGQSASPAFFNKKFEDEGIDARYIPFEIESTDVLPRIIEEHPELCGFNVTIPYKEMVMPYCDFIDEKAAEIGAVNAYVDATKTTKTATKAPAKKPATKALQALCCLL